MNSKLIHALSQTFIFSISVALLQVVLTAINSRLLSPEDYGYFAVANAVVIIVTQICLRGMSIIILSAYPLRPIDITNSYITAVVFSILTILIVFFLAPLFSTQQTSEGKTELIITRFMTVCSVITLLGTPTMALLRRQLRSAQVGMITFIAVAAGNGLCTVGLAWSGFGAWSSLLERWSMPSLPQLEAGFWFGLISSSYLIAKKCLKTSRLRS